MGQVIEALEHPMDSADEVGQREPIIAGNQSSTPKMSPEEWLEKWEALAEEIGKVWPAGVSAVDVVSEMRR